MISWVAILSVGILLGLVAGFYYSMLSGSDKKRLQELEVKLKEAENSMSGYKQNVTDHFVTTSSLINNMTESYRAIHEHMSTGAKTLCSQSLLDSPASQYQLDIPQATVPDSTSTEKQTATSNNVNTTTESTNQKPETTATQDAAEDINKTETVAATATDTITDTTTTSDNSSNSDSNSDSNSGSSSKEVNKTESLIADRKSAEDASNKETDSVAAVTQQLDIASIASAATATSDTNLATTSETDSDTVSKPTDIEEEKEKPLLFDKKKDQNSNVIH